MYSYGGKTDAHAKLETNGSVIVDNDTFSSDFTHFLDFRWQYNTNNTYQLATDFLSRVAVLGLYVVYITVQALQNIL